MSAIALIFAISLANQVTAQSKITTSPANLTTEIKTLPEASTETAFALQIPRIRTAAEETPAASAGNNLNVVGPSVPSNSFDVQEENFQAISTVYPIAKAKSNEKKYYDGNGGNVPVLQSADGNDVANKKTISAENPEKTSKLTEPSKLVWDNCLETIYRDNYNSQHKPHSDMENAHNLEIQNSKSSTTTVSKRDSLNTNNNSTALKAWLEKYNNLKKAKEDEISRQKLNNLLFKNTSITSLNVPVTNVPIVPITRDILKDYIEPVNISLDVVVTENSIKASNVEDWLNGKDKTKIKFSSMPQTQTYLIPKFKLEEGFHPFGFMSEFFYLIYPFDFPVGLIKDIVWGEFTFPYSFLQSIKMESTFLAFVIIFTCIALVIPSYLFILLILSLMSRARCNDDVLESGALFPQTEETSCSDRVLTIVTFFVVILCCLFISGMVLSNEQSRLAASDGRNVVSCACTDIGAWLTAAARELHQSLVPPIDLVVYAYRNDLDNVESLLGEPIQEAIASESGIDLVFDSLADIITETEDISNKISSLRDISTKSSLMVAVASDKVKELAQQIDSHKKQCTAKDAPLCDTLNTNSLDLHMKFDTILQHEPQLLELRFLGVENLTMAISAAKKEFKMLPSAVTTQTSSIRDDIMRDIEVRRQSVHSSSKIFNDIVRHLTAGLHVLARQLEAGLDRLQKYEFWRWLFILACNVAFGFVMLLILAGMLCGCGNTKIHAKRTLQVSSVWLCAISLILWSVICAIFLIAGHAEVYVCHALWDTPEYKTLSALLDKPSPLLTNDEGIFDSIFRELENVTIEVSVKDILRDCERNRPAYNVFQLDRLIDMNKETSYFEWGELQADLGRLATSIDVGLLKTISVAFSKLLNDMLVVTNVDLAKYRMEYNAPVVGKDLPSLVDQLENIAAQVTDLNTAGRLETLATRTKRLHLTNIKPLEQLRADLVFKLTELELQLMPFRKKLNISLSHIHTAQYYIDNQGDIIAQKKVSTYVSRLVSHAAGWRTHVLSSTGKHAARCRPLYAVYAAMRSLLCTKYVASLHGWWVCGLLLGIFWCSTLTPLCVKLWRSYGRKIRSQDSLTLTHLCSGQDGTPTTALCENSTWNSPGPPPPPPRNDSW
ncbi:prominin-1-A [Epargyreus clarus]|uniref:prominin-1-A n=1 Tax=Epargyreus clarus TaxID=520877 RepID=UPI003C2B967C